MQMEGIEPIVDYENGKYELDSFLKGAPLT